MNVQLEGKHLNNLDKAEQIVDYAMKRDISLSEACVELDCGTVPRLTNAHVFYISIWSSYNERQLKNFFPGALNA